MSIKKLNNFAIGNEDFSALFETVNKAYKGKNDITLSNYSNELEPDVKVGSVFDNNGAIFVIDGSDITPEDYGTISVSTVFYLYYNAGTNLFEYSETIPTWDDEKQGYYNINNRALFSMFKDSGGSLYQEKTLLKNKSLDQIDNLKVLNLEIPNGIPGGIKTNNFIHNNSITENVIFDTIDSFIPNVGDDLNVNGGIGLGGFLDTLICSKMVRVSNTAIDIYGHVSSALLGTNKVDIYTMDNGGAVVYRASISW